MNPNGLKPDPSFPRRRESSPFRRPLATFLIALPFIVSLSSCPSRESHAPVFDTESIATVNGKRIPRSRLTQAISGVGFHSNDEMRAALANKEYISQTIASLIAEELLYQEAVRLAVHPSAPTPPSSSQARPAPGPTGRERTPTEGLSAELQGKARTAFQYFAKGTAKRSTVDSETEHRRELIAGLVRQEIESTLKISDDETRRYYHQHVDEYRRPPLVRARQILVKTRDEAVEILQLIRSGLDFASVARERSLAPDADKGGDLGYFSADQIQPEIGDACFDLPIGGISREVETPYGYHLFQVVDKLPARTLSFDEVRDDILGILRTRKRELAYQAYIRALRDKAKIELD